MYGVCRAGKEIGEEKMGERDGMGWDDGKFM